MFTLTLVDFEYETRVSIWEFEILIIYKMIVLPSFHFAKRINSQNANETLFINVKLRINLFMNIRISNWNN